MNQRELGELRRRFRPEKSAISRVYGCYVNSSREIIAYIDQSLGLMPQEEAEKYLGLLKKALSGTLGRNLIDIVFSTQQVADSEEHRLLSALRTSELKDAEARDAFYQQVIGSLDMGENNYLILLGADAYDVPHRGKDGEVDRDACEEAVSYSRTSSIRSSLTQCSAQSRPCPPPSSGRPFSPPCAALWRGRAAWRWCSLSTTTCASGSRNTRRAGTRSRWLSPQAR